MSEKNQLSNWSIKKHAAIIFIFAVIMVLIYVCGFEYNFLFVAFFIGVVSTSVATFSSLEFSSMEAKRVYKFMEGTLSSGYEKILIPKKISTKNNEVDQKNEAVIKDEINKVDPEKMVLKDLWLDQDALVELNGSLRLNVYISAVVGGGLAVGSVIFFSGFGDVGKYMSSVFPSYEAYTPVVGNKTQAIFWCFLFACLGRCSKNTLNRAEDELLDIYYSGLDKKPEA